MSNKIYIDVVIDDKGTTKKVAIESKKLGKALDSAGSSAHSADRQLKGAAKASSNTTKNFSKMAQGITGGLVPAYASLAAQLFALSAAFRFLERAADLANLRQSQVDYARSTGVALQSVTKRLREASQGMLGFQEAAQAAAIGAAKGFTASQLVSLAEGAGKAATALGRDYQDSFDRLIRGVSKAEPELLDELGITLRLEKATTDYAAAIGKTVKQLTAAERSQAVLIETQRQLNSQFGAVEAAVNPFTKLRKTMVTLVDDLSQKALPAFEGLANIINNNATAALTALGAVAAMVLLNITGLKEGVSAILGSLVGSFAGMASSVNKSMQSVGSAINTKASASIKTLKSLEEALLDVQEYSEIGAAVDAETIVGQGSRSQLLRRLAAGEELSAAQTKQLDKALRNAEAQYKKHGKVVSGIFAKASKESFDSFKRNFRGMQDTSLTTSETIRRNLAQGAIKGLRGVQVAAKAATGAIRVMGVAAKTAGKAFAFLGKLTFYLAIIQTVSDALSSVANAPYTLVNSIISTIETVAKGIEAIVNQAIKLVNNVINKIAQSSIAKRIFGLEGEFKPIPTVNLSEGLGEGIKAGLEYVGVNMEALKAAEERAKAQEKEAQRVAALKESYALLAKDIKGISSSIDLTIDPVDSTKKIANALVSTDLGAVLGKAVSDGTVDMLINSLKDSGIEKLGSRVSEAFNSGDVEALNKLTTAASAYLTNLTSVDDIINNISTLAKSGDLLGTEILIAGLLDSAKAADSAAKSIGGVGGAVDKAEKVFEGAGGSSAFLERLREIRSVSENLTRTKADLAIATEKASMLSGEFAEKESRVLRVLEEEAKLIEYKNELNSLAASLSITANEQERLSIERKIRATAEEIRLQREKIKVAKKAASDISQIGLTLGNSLQTGFSGFFDSIIRGTESVKDAFANMAVSILESLSKIIAQQAAMKLLGSLTSFAPGVSSFLGFGGTAAASTGGISVADTFSSGMAFQRYGGVVKPPAHFSAGGIARGSDAGYPAVLHGTEAVVPLPNGRSIPVHMKGAGQQNNVTVNVAVDSDGNATQRVQSQQGSAELGTLVAKAVQKELQNQKRSGGILNPYGAA